MRTIYGDSSMKMFPCLLIALSIVSYQSESASAKMIIARDGKRMILIAGGTFRMGSELGYREESPVHAATVKSFYMDQQLVTNHEFRIFCDSTNTSYPADPRWEEMPNYFLDYPEYPVVNVSLDRAAAYASWAGKRIPTEAEWEYAACGGLEQPLYPWGNAAPDAARAKFADRNADFEWRDFRVATPWKYTAPVGSFAPNGYGLYDMAGNVYQWTIDWFFRYVDTVRDTVQIWRWLGRQQSRSRRLLLLRCLRSSCGAPATAAFGHTFFFDRLSLREGC